MQHRATGLHEYGTALHMRETLPLILTEIAVPASRLPIDIQVTLSPPSGSIILLLPAGGTTISAQSTSNGLIGDGLTSPKEGKAELKVGAIWLGRARPGAPAASRWQLRSRCIASRIASHCSADCAVHSMRRNQLRRHRGCSCGHGARGKGRRDSGVGCSGTVILFN